MIDKEKSQKNHCKNHQITKEDKWKRKSKNNSKTYITINKMEIMSLPINNYFKCKWM